MTFIALKLRNEYNLKSACSQKYRAYFYIKIMFKLPVKTITLEKIK